MRRSMLKSKIHRATVTEADLHYEGSLTLDARLLHAADIVPYEEVHVWNVTRGSRLRTYAIAGEAGSGVVCINGAAAHLARPGDIVILATFTELEDIAGNPLVVDVVERAHEGRRAGIAPDDLRHDRLLLATDRKIAQRACAASHQLPHDVTAAWSAAPKRHPHRTWTSPFRSPASYSTDGPCSRPNEMR